MKKILILVPLILLIATSAYARTIDGVDYISIRDDGGDKINIYNDGTIPVSLTSSTGTTVGIVDSAGDQAIVADDGSLAVYLTPSNTATIGIVDASGDRVNVDASVSGLQVINIMHHEIHEGNAFTAFISDLALADDASINIVLTSTASVHLRVEGEVGGDSQFFMYEAPTLATGGTDFTPIAFNREINSASATTVGINAEYGATGTTILDRIIPAGTGIAGIAGSSGSDNEYILMPNTIYMIRIENEAGSAEPAGITIDWYEE